MFDHNIFQDNLVGVDFCEKMVKETNPGVWEKATKTEAPHAKDHGYRTIADIMTSLNPFEGEFYRETLASEPLHARDVLPDGRPARASVHALSGRRRHGAFHSGVHRLSGALDEVHRVHEEESSRCTTISSTSFTRRCRATKRSANAASCSAAGVRSRTRTSAITITRRWRTGARRCSSRPGIVVDGKLVTTNLVDINLGIRILLGSSFYEDWADNGNGDVRQDTIRSAIPWTSAIRGIKPRFPNRRSAISKAITPGSCRRAGIDKRTGDHLALDTGGGPIARLWSTALAEPGGHRLRESHRQQRERSACRKPR